MLTPADLELHARLGITPAVLDAFHVQRVTDAQARELLALPRRTGRLDGIVYPYLDPISRRPVTRRLRRDHPEIEHGKPKDKYLSAFGDHRHLYFACDDPAVLRDAAVPAILVESEKGALAVRCAAERCGRVVLALGLGGCWGWRGRKGLVESANGGHVDETGPLPDVDRIAWTGRDAILVFDSNVQTNAQVQRARRALGAELARRGAHVRVVDLPVEDGINGPDDYLGRHGSEPFFAIVDGAPDVATADVIVRLNQRHAVVRESGKTIVVTEEQDPVLGRRTLTRSSFADFRNFYLSETVVVGTKKTGAPVRESIGQFWLTHPDRRQYDGVIMSPNADVPGYLNLWRGFAVTPAPGDCARITEHLYTVICRKDDDLYAYVNGWLAMAVQHPECRAEVALALRGKRGVGKGLFVRTFGELFGQHYLHIANTKHLTGHFNAHLQDAIVLFADEAFWAGDKAGESVLKMLITEPVIPIERKGHDVVLAKNLLHLVLASNAEWVVPAGMDERRFCVLDVADHDAPDRDYFAALVDEIAHGGREAWLDALLRVPLDDFDIRAVPGTDALRQQKVLSLAPNERWLFDKLNVGRLLPTHSGWERSVLKDDLYDDYIARLQKAGVERRATETELGIFLNRILGPQLASKRRMCKGLRHWYWDWEELKTCRDAFDAATQSRHPWPDEAAAEAAADQEERALVMGWSGEGV